MEAVNLLNKTKVKEKASNVAEKYIKGTLHKKTEFLL